MRRTLVTLVALGVGATLLVWQVQQLGLDRITTGLREVGWGFLGILLLSLLRFAARSLAWTTLLGQRVPLRRAVAATISGDALGNVTPLSLLVSEPVKAMYLDAGTASSRSLAALAAENFFYSVSVGIYVTLGTAAMLRAFPLPAEIRVAGISALVLMAGVLAVAAIPTRTHAWGYDAHRFIMERAIGLLPVELRPFFEQYKSMLVERAIDPDTWQVAGFDDQEDPNHFIDLDWEGYGKYPYDGLPRDYFAAVAKFGYSVQHRRSFRPPTLFDTIA